MKRFIAVWVLVMVMLISVTTVVSCNKKQENSDTGITTTDDSFVMLPTTSVPDTTSSIISTPEPIITDVITVPSYESSKPVIDEQSTYYNVTAEERDMLATLCYLEAGGCSQECQRLVISVVFNRLDSGRWKKDVNNDGKITLYDIVYYPNAFSPAKLISKYHSKTTQSCYDAVDYIIENGPACPNYVRYFRADHDFDWDNYRSYTSIDNTYFGYLETWEQGAW